MVCTVYSHIFTHAHAVEAANVPHELPQARVLVLSEIALDHFTAVEMT